MAKSPLLDPDERRWLGWAIALALALSALVVFWDLRLHQQGAPHTFLRFLTIFSGLAFPLGVWSVWLRLHREARDRPGPTPLAPQPPETPAPTSTRSLRLRLLHSPDAVDEAGLVRARLVDLPARLAPNGASQVQVLGADGRDGPADLVLGILGWRFADSAAGEAADQQQQARWRALIEELQGPGAPPARLYRRTGLPPSDI